jgi:phosphoglycolate phosphatase
MNREDEGVPYLQPLLGIVFDLDGTLVESHHDFRRMRREVIRIAEHHGVAPGHLSLTEPIPTTMEKAREELERNGAPEGSRYRFETEVNRTIDAIEMEALPQTTARVGAIPLLAALTERGYRIGVLTRSSETFCRAALAQTKMLDYLPSLRTRSAPGPAKPSPEALLLLLKQMGVPQDRAAFVGDHLLDAQCARHAHIRFYGLLATHASADSTTAEAFHAAGATEVLADLPAFGRLFGVSPNPPKVPAGA